MANACDLYVSPPFSRTWRTQAFPSSNPAVNRMSAAELVTSRIAWNFFEEVESADAATRVRLSDAGGWTPPSNPIVTPTLWYPLTAPGELALYRKGQRLHQRVCPNYDWTSQRNLPIPTAPLIDVGPALCPDCSGGEAGADTINNAPPASTGCATVSEEDTRSSGTRSVPAVQQQALPIRTRSGVTPQTSNTPKTATTPHDSNTPKTATTPQTSNTPKTATTPQASNTPHDSNTPKTATTPHPPGTPDASNTPKPPGTPVVAQVANPSEGTIDTFSLKEIPTPEIGKTVSISSVQKPESPQQIGSPRPIGSYSGSLSASQIGTPRPIGSQSGSRSASQIGTPRPIGSGKTSRLATAASTRPVTPPPEADQIELIVTEKVLAATN
jgi:hypothetical protein